MYIGIDFLIDKGCRLYLSEVNTGTPAGAFEYDLVYREQFSRPSGIFDRIDRISRDNFSLPFREYIRNLPYIEDLKMLKAWMDGMGDFPEDPAPELKLEDKWVQYKLFSRVTDMLPTVIYDRDNRDFYNRYCPGSTKFVIKKRLSRNGRGFRVFKKGERMDNLEGSADDYIIQPWIDSSVSGLSMSIRAAAFCGEFVCMFASLSPRDVSNHGYRFYIAPGNRFGLSKSVYSLRDIVKKSWEADILFGEDVPAYLEKSVTVETISDGQLIIPMDIYSDIKRISSLVSNIIMEADFDKIENIS